MIPCPYLRIREATLKLIFKRGTTDQEIFPLGNYRNPVPHSCIPFSSHSQHKQAKKIRFSSKLGILRKQSNLKQNNKKSLRWSLTRFLGLSEERKVSSTLMEPSVHRCQLSTIMRKWGRFSASLLSKWLMSQSFFNTEYWLF